MVLKLDFAKAFDSVNWDSFLKILHARGFSEKWCKWVHAILQTLMSAVVVNGIPGRWMKCRQGLRQGDPISPYLFLIVADVLPALIRNDGSIKHPIAVDLPCPELQYADDTLILLPADAAQVRRLRQLLDDFADATGLKTNYNKRNVSPTTGKELQELLGCKLETFLQTYLGLPLSGIKLNISAFSPLIGKADKHLAGWQNQFLNAWGRAILINSVLDGTAAYLMAATQMSKGVLDGLDSRRRAFLWTRAAKTTGSQCLVAWPTVCQTKEKGGLGVRELHLQNQCLLLKLVHGLHHPGDLAWAQWARTGIDLANLTSRDAVGAHWDALRNLLPFYHCITSVVLGDDH